MASEVVREGMRTPWGTADSASVIAEGIGQVGTPGHGGIKLSAARNRMVPAPLRREGGWYEEDCDVYVPMFVFYDDMPERMRSRITRDECLQGMRRWYPEQVDAAYPEPTTRADDEPYDPGDPEPDGVRCDTCRGNGVVRRSGRPYRFPERAQEAVRDGRAVDCPTCKGTGILGLTVAPDDEQDALLQAAQDSGHLQVITVGR